ncbi:MAG: DUF1801 domain-containing protein [Opitutaceae bacterium]|jgi:hypothetical protein|nr:DUF1801 domain-containing protein [Opitutaceae bacterium]
MPSSRVKPSRQSAANDPGAEVDAFLAALEHAHKDAIEELRRVVRGAHASITEGIKWNAPSFRTTEWFATTHLRDKAGVGLILHLGAKVRDLPDFARRIEDPEHVLQWLAKDRARVTFAGLKDVKSKAVALQELVRQWIAHV